LYTAEKTIYNITNEIKKRGYSQKEVYSACKINENTVSRMNDSKGISSFYLAKIADYLNCSVDYLLGRTPCPDINISGNTQNNVNGDNNISVNNNDELASELSSLLKSLNLRKRTELMTMIYQFVDTHKE
jgi:DNA-binding Xre family transcriptional regulator